MGVTNFQKNSSFWVHFMYSYSLQIFQTKHFKELPNVNPPCKARVESYLHFLEFWWYLTYLYCEISWNLWHSSQRLINVSHSFVTHTYWVVRCVWLAVCGQLNCDSGRVLNDSFISTTCTSWYLDNFHCNVSRNYSQLAACLSLIHISEPTRPY